MPELPEVETIVKTLSPQIAGKYISNTHVLHDKVAQAGKDLLPFVERARISCVFRRAKLLLIGLEPQQVISSVTYHDANLPTAIPLFMVFHLKMTGRFFVHPPACEPLKHTRIIFDLSFKADERNDAAGRLFFDDMRTFGYCRIMLPEDFASWPFWKGLGPEPLVTSKNTLAERFFIKRSSIKSALLDQKIVAGVGNIYADEALFAAKIAPDRPAQSISLSDRICLASYLQKILRQSIEECGSSIRDYRDAKGNAGAFQNNFSVYGRKGESCHICNNPLSFARIAGRGTVYCPYCQK